MRIALSQLNFIVADLEGNRNSIIRAIEQAKKEKADLIVFSELAVCGYPPDDLLDYPHFVRECEESVREIAGYATGISVILGSPMENPGETGRRLYNAACILQDGVLKDVVYKTLLPTYDVFNESRYFEVNDTFRVIRIGDRRCAVTICEDLWHESDRFDYMANPLAELAVHQPDIIINISASPFNKGKKPERLEVLRQQARAYGLPLVYVNQTGVNTDLIFDGNSLVMNENGEVVHELPAFAEMTSVFETGTAHKPLPAVVPDHTGELYHALIYGIKDYFRKMGFRNAVIGSSGGIDSAVVQALATAALGPENVTALLMPSQYSSEGSVSDALRLSENLGNPHYRVPISEIFTSFEKALQPMFGDLPFNVAEENIQARSRAILLMAYSNKFGHILLNTSNKSEMSVGYTTLYGDMCGSLSVMGDVFKTDVYRLAAYINRENTIIPSEIIDKAPSAELRPGQKDSDSLPDYALLDQILRMYVEEHMGPEEISLQGFDRELTDRIVTMVNRSEYKRFQAPPILRVSGKAFGRGRIMPLVSRW